MATVSGRASTPQIPGNLTSSNSGSALLLDIAGGQIRASLVDRVEGGSSRFVAAIADYRGLDGVDDLPARLHDTVEALERRTSRRLRESNRLVSPQRRDGSGTDAVVLTTDLPLAVAIVGPKSGAIRRRVDAYLDATVAVRMTSFDPAAVRQRGQSVLESFFELLARQPDLIILLPDPPAKRGKETIGIDKYLASALDSRAFERPVILGVGEKGFIDALGNSVGRMCDYRTLDIGSPNAGEELRILVMAIWRDTLERRLAGSDFVQSWLSVPAMPTADGFATALRYLASRRGSEVWGIDLGASNTTIVRATSDLYRLAVLSKGLVNAVDWFAVGANATSPITGLDTERLRDLLWNRNARPSTRPVSTDELALIRHLTVAAVAGAAADSSLPAPNWKKDTGLLVLRGDAAITIAESPSAVCQIAQAIGARGPFEVAVDRLGLLPGLGTLAAADPSTAVEVMSADGLTQIGTFVIGTKRSAVVGSAAKVEFKQDEKPLVAVSLAAGGCQTLDLAASEFADLSVSPANGFDFGRGGGRNQQLKATGGTLGVVLSTYVPVQSSKRRPRE